MNRALISLLLLLIACREKVPVLNGSHADLAHAFVLGPDQKITVPLAPGEQSWFIAVALTEARMLRAELSATRGADLRLAVLDGNASALATADDNGSSLAEEMFPVFLPAGRFFLKLTASSSESGATVFFYRLFKPPADAEREPNNTPETANAVAALHASGFFGPQFASVNGTRHREQDCFEFAVADPTQQRAEFLLTGVDGYRSALDILQPSGDSLFYQEAGKTGEPIKTAPVAIPKSGKLIACVRAVQVQPNASRDYFDLTLHPSSAQLRFETEPNDKPLQAAAIAESTMEGTVGAIGDVDHFFWLNRRDYPVVVRIELQGEGVALLKMEAGQRLGQRTYEGSAALGEVAENVRVDAGEKAFVTVRCNRKCTRKSFRPAPYTIKLSDQAITDETEAEPNDTAPQADTLVDLTQKWGFLNPPGDQDYYRFQADSPVVRDILVESKIACRLRLEHQRAGKTLAITAGTHKLIYNSELIKGDLLRLQCAGPTGGATESSYRLSINEP